MHDMSQVPIDVVAKHLAAATAMCRPRLAKRDIGNSCRATDQAWGHQGKAGRLVLARCQV